MLFRSDPDRNKVFEGKHFRKKDLAQQQAVHIENYPEYREVKTRELMTTVLLYDLTYKERLLSDYLRCEEPDASDGRDRVCVGVFYARGLAVIAEAQADAGSLLGLALVRGL